MKNIIIVHYENMHALIDDKVVFLINYQLSTFWAQASRSLVVFVVTRKKHSQDLSCYVMQ